MAAPLLISAFLFIPSQSQATCFTFACAQTDTPSFDLTLTHTGEAASYGLSWEAVLPSTTSAIVTYFVFQVFGDTTPLTTGAAIFAGASKLSFNFAGGAGTRSFIVVSSDSFTGELHTSDVEVHGFIHNLTAEGITRTDGDGTQRGVDQRWTFGYSLDRDAFVTAQIFLPTDVFTINANGFDVTAATPLKTLVQNTPRSGELANHSIRNSEAWDSRSSSGVVVSNNIYQVYISATDVNGTLRGTILTTVPVDIIRIMTLSATGITSSVATANISYFLTGDANVRILIAQPGSGFTTDSGGNIQPVNRTTGLTDLTLIVSTFTYQRKAGAIIETWSGISSSGSVVPSAVYPVGISATDDYGNHAIDASGNDSPIFTVVSVERQVSSGGGSSSSDTTAPTLTSISPTSGASVSGFVSTITVVLADSQSALNLAGSVISVRDPNNTTVTGTLSNNGSDTLTYIFATALQTAGTYSVTIAALDIAGNSASLTSSFVIANSLSASDFSGSTIVYPNPAKSGNVTITYNLGTAATVDWDIFNVLGDRVFSTSFNDSQGSNTHTWNRRNSDGEVVGSGMYLVYLKATGGGQTVKTVKKLVVIR